jgi:hypothetical protein
VASYGRHFFYRLWLRCWINILNNKQDRQCTSNAKLRFVRATIFAVEKQLLLHILSAFGGLRYPAHNAHACPALQYLSTLSHKLQDFRKMLLNIKCVFWFSRQSLSKEFLILKETERDMIKMCIVLHVKYGLF